MPSQPSNSGIVTDEASGERHIPESKRADGSTRKAIKIRPGYRPPEDVEVYKNRTAENFRNRGKGPVPGAEGLVSDNKAPAAGQSSAASKNAKRRAKKKEAASGADTTDKDAATNKSQEDEKQVNAAETAPAPEKAENPEAETEKKVRNLKKKLRLAKELRDKSAGGQALLPEQLAKVIRINELVRELEALGFDAEGEAKAEGESKGAEKAAAKDAKGSS